MKISNRDKKLIVIILIALVIALPYLLVIKPTKEKQVAVEGEIVTLQERYDYLSSLNEQREFYLSEIDRMTAEREVIMLDFAHGIRQENIIMFLRGLEFEMPMAMTSLSFSGNSVTPIIAGTVDEAGNVTGAIDGVRSQTSVSYECNYEDMKEFLEYIMNYKERMVVSSVDMTYNDATGKLSGMFILQQYAIAADGRELAPAQIPAMNHGNESVFGTYISDEELAEQLAEEAEGEEE